MASKICVDIRKIKYPNIHVSPQHIKGTDGTSTIYELEKSMKPILLVLRTIGIFPVARGSSDKWTHGGPWQHRFTSIVTLYSVCVYLLTMTLLWFTTGVRLREFTSKYRQFDVMFFILTCISYFIIVIVLPLIVWTEGRAMADYLNKWDRYQECYFGLTGQPVGLNFKRRAVIICCFEFILIISFELVYQLTNDDGILVDWLVALNEWYLDVVRFFVLTAWYLVCAALSTAADNLWENFHKELSIRASCQVVSAYRMLWLELSRLVQQTGRTLCYSFSFYIMYMFVTLTLFVYHTLSNLTHQLRIDLVLMAIECLVMLLALFIICDSANRTTRQVGDVFRYGLLTERSYVVNTSVIEELETFLRIIDTCPPIISLGDYVIVNRALFVSLGSMMTTYLVVLLQFNLSSDDGNHLYNISLQI